ncbi:hypothetical protein O3M35_010237 [Rhynocoris fuscipes]|uniref:Peroxidase n=1 Tax=Rhynocoris fuscipes TaxID=488301 RepID=A0AAW1D592_9HEMI
MRQIYKGFSLFMLLSTCAALFENTGYQALVNYSTPTHRFHFSAPVSFAHSHTVFHPPPTQHRFQGLQTHQELPSLHEFGIPSSPKLPLITNDIFSSFTPDYLTPTYKPNFPPPSPPRPAQKCPQQIFGPCRALKYRSIDGACNNYKNPGVGRAMTTYNRLLPPRYSDGVHDTPISVTGHDLPGARLVSFVMFPEKTIDDPVWTLVSMSWGQIMTHDMSMATGNTQGKRIYTQCCSPDGAQFTPRHLAPAPCLPIEIPDNDPFFAKFGQRCMNFMRTTTDVDAGCTSPHSQQPQEQVVAVTHFMDASFIYGSTMDRCNSLREGIGGRLHVEVRHGQQWPPTARNISATCDNQDDNESCYRFGDVRGNQNPQLTVLQVYLLREHNRVADILHHYNPHWDDERLFQEARRIVIAEYQHINYREWLPIFIGTKNMMRYGLLYDTDGYVNDYREDVDPRVLNEHATAAFRYFHSAIQGFFHLMGEHRSVVTTKRLSDYFNRPSVLEKGDNLDKVARGMVTQSQEEIDPFITREVTNYLFKANNPFGLDLRAFDIQRGRDHGLASYNDYRHYCGLPRAHSFEDFTDYISRENVEKLSLLYPHPDDVDLVVGGSLEAHVKDTLTGPTFLCIMLEQFYRTRTGDKYFYENGNQPGAFTLEQLREIKKATISRIFCDNGENIKVMQPEGFRVIGPKNQLLPCELLPSIDLSHWAEEVSNPIHNNYDFKFFVKK